MPSNDPAGLVPMLCREGEKANLGASWGSREVVKNRSFKSGVTSPETSQFRVGSPLTQTLQPPFSWARLALAVPENKAAERYKRLPVVHTGHGCDRASRVPQDTVQ